MEQGTDLLSGAYSNLFSFVDDLMNYRKICTFYTSKGPV